MLSILTDLLERNLKVIRLIPKAEAASTNIRATLAGAPSLHCLNRYPGAHFILSTKPQTEMATVLQPRVRTDIRP